MGTINRYFYLIVSIFLLLQIDVFAEDPPKWIEDGRRKFDYPDKTYLTGFAIDMDTKKDDIDEVLANLRETAKGILINTVKVKVKNISTLDVRDASGQDVQETFRQYSESFSELEIKGLKVESYFDKKDKKAYAFAYAKRNVIVENYMAKIYQAKLKINENVKIGDNFMQKGNKQDALKKYLSCGSDFREIEEALSVVFILKNVIDEQLDKENVELVDLKLLVDNKVADIYQNKELSLDDAAFFIANTYKTQVENANIPVRLGNVTYQDTKMGSSFSRRFYSVLEQKLNSETNLQIITNVSPGSDINNLFSGNYWKDGNYLKVITTIRNTNSGKILYSAESKISIDAINNADLNYKPENFEDAYSRMLDFKKGEVVGGGLNIDIWTNKGQDNLMFVKDEHMKLYIRANRECYVRFIYHMADGSKVMLLDNYYIGSGNINKVIEMPYEFECAEPFGVETLQLNAQSDEFSPLNIRTEYGYDFIVDNFSSVLVKTRGFKRVEPTKPLKAEKRLTITTYDSKF